VEAVQIHVSGWATVLSVCAGGGCAAVIAAIVAESCFCCRVDLGGRGQGGAGAMLEAMRARGCTNMCEWLGDLFSCGVLERKGRQR
jgi:hypothetical protein